MNKTTKELGLEYGKMLLVPTKNLELLARRGFVTVIHSTGGYSVISVVYGVNGYSIKRKSSKPVLKAGPKRVKVLKDSPELQAYLCSQIAYLKRETPCRLTRAVSRVLSMSPRKYYAFALKVDVGALVSYEDNNLAMQVVNGYKETFCVSARKNKRTGELGNFSKSGDEASHMDGATLIPLLEELTPADLKKFSDPVARIKDIMLEMHKDFKGKDIFMDLRGNIIGINEEHLRIEAHNDMVSLFLANNKMPLVSVGGPDKVFPYPGLRFASCRSMLWLSSIFHVLSGYKKMLARPGCLGLEREMKYLKEKGYDISKLSDNKHEIQVASHSISVKISHSAATYQQVARVTPKGKIKWSEGFYSERLYLALRERARVAANELRDKDNLIVQLKALGKLMGRTCSIANGKIYVNKTPKGGMKVFHEGYVLAEMSNGRILKGDSENVKIALERVSRGVNIKKHKPIKKLMGDINKKNVTVGAYPLGKGYRLTKNSRNQILVYCKDDNSYTYMFDDTVESYPWSGGRHELGGRHDSEVLVAYLKEFKSKIPRKSPAQLKIEKWLDKNSGLQILPTSLNDKFIIFCGGGNISIVKDSTYVCTKALKVVGGPVLWYNLEDLESLWVSLKLFGSAMIDKLPPRPG